MARTWLRKVPAVFYMFCLALLNYVLHTILRTYTLHYSLHQKTYFRNRQRRSLHCGRQRREERSETHYAEKRWGREMASKRRKEWRERAGKQFCGENGRGGLSSGRRRRMVRACCHLARELPDMMSASEGGHVIEDVVREAASILLYTDQI